jgi:hypothetical protein
LSYIRSSTLAGWNAATARVHASPRIGLLPHYLSLITSCSAKGVPLGIDVRAESRDASGTERVTEAEAGPELAHTSAALSPGGPDDHGLSHDGRRSVGLPHRRLSIIDLCPLGHQPMHSASGRFTVTFNGEIYNHLRAHLAASRSCERRRQAGSR